MGETRRAFARPELRPYLPDLRFVRTVGAGLCVICTAGWAAVRRGMHAVLGASGPGTSGWQDKAERVGMGVFVVLAVAAAGTGVAAGLGRTLAPYLPWVAGVGGLVLVGAAWMVAPDGTPRKKIISTGGVATAPGSEEVAAPLDAATVARTVHAIATPRGWKGAHLDDILAHLPGRSRAELLTVLADAEIPVVEQLKLTLPGGRQRNRQGVRLTALPAGRGEAPPPPAPGPVQRPPGLVPEHSPRVGHVTVHGGG